MAEGGRKKKAAKKAAKPEFAPQAISPFAEAPDGGAANLEARPFFGKILIRGLGEDAEFLRAAEGALGAALPLTPNAAVALKGKGKGKGEGEERIFWMGPSEWLVWTEAREETLAALTEALADTHSSVTDVSDYYAVLRLSGGLAREVLAHGCPLDLHESAFKPGECAQTRFRAAAIFIFQADDKPTYDVQTRWSYAEYLRRYLAEVAELCAAAARK